MYYGLRRVPAVTGRDLRNARPTLDENNRPAVSFSLNNEGARKFGVFTQANVGRQLAIVLDSRVVSAPRIESRIDDEGRITATSPHRKRRTCRSCCARARCRPSLTYLEERTVGPSLGADSIRAGVTAALGGVTLVMVFMLFYYRLAGLNALTSIVVNLVVLLGLMAYIDATMTLPGIAGFILTIGIGVDSNVLIFERIKEELETGKAVKQAVAAGFDRVFLTILDTHVASLISAAFLFQFGTGPIRGFAMTLTIGLLSNVFTAVLRLAHHVRALPVAPSRGDVEHLGRMRILTNVNFDCLRWRWHALAVSWLVILLGVGTMVTRGLPLGVDFSGGTLFHLRFEQAGDGRTGARRDQRHCRRKPGADATAMPAATSC